MAFTLKERQILGIHGLLPPNVFTPEEQKTRVMDNVRRFTDDLDKYIYLAGLLDRNEKLFYQVCLSQLTPTWTVWKSQQFESGLLQGCENSTPKN